MSEFPIHTIQGRVELFPQEGGWYYVAVPKKYTEMYAEFADRGLIPITATLGDTEWKTSLMPKGDGTHFIALNARVRKAANLDVGNRVRVSFRVRG